MCGVHILVQMCGVHFVASPLEDEGTLPPAIERDIAYSYKSVRVHFAPRSKWRSFPLEYS